MTPKSRGCGKSKKSPCRSLTLRVERSEGNGMDHHAKLATKVGKLATKPANNLKNAPKLATSFSKLGAKAPKLVAKAPKLVAKAPSATKKRGPEMLGATRPKSGVVPGGFAPSTRKGDGLGWEEMSEQAGRSLRRFIERSQGRGVNASR